MAAEAEAEAKQQEQQLWRISTLEDTAQCSSLAVCIK